MRSFFSSSSVSRAFRINNSFQSYSATSQLRTSAGRSIASFSSSASSKDEAEEESDYTSWTQSHWRTPDNTSPLGESKPMRTTTAESFRVKNPNKSGGKVQTAYGALQEADLQEQELPPLTAQQEAQQDEQLLSALDELEPSAGAVSLTSRGLAEPKKVISRGGKVKTGQKMRERVARYVTEALMSPKMYRDWHLFLDRHHLTSVSIHSVDINMSSIIVEWEPPIELVFSNSQYFQTQEKLDESKKWYSNRERSNRPVDEFDVAQALERLASRLKMDLARKMGTRNVRTIIFKLHDYEQDQNTIKMEDALGFGMGGMEGIKYVKGLEWMKDVDKMEGMEELRNMPEYEELQAAMAKQSSGTMDYDRTPVMGGYKEKKPYARRKRKHEKQQEQHDD